MSEFITIQVGQCGNQIGSSFWPLILQEYGVNNVPGGISRNNTLKNTNTSINDSFHSFFTAGKNLNLNSTIKYTDLKKYNVKARAILIDMEDSVVEKYHSGPLRNLFDKSCTVKDYMGSGNNWAEGYYTHGAECRDRITSILRKAVEKCNNLLGFLMIYSVGGGTGSGLGSYVLELLDEIFPNVERFVTCVYPNGSEDVITCPYNSALATKVLTDNATCVFPVENRALLDIVQKQANQKQCIDTLNYIATCKPFQDMNTIVINMLLHLTSGSRFSGGMNIDMNDISTNLIPFPNMHYISSSVSPITVSYDRYKRQQNSCKINNEIFNECCDKKNQLLKLNPLGLQSVLLGACLVGRGQFTMSDMRGYVDQLQSRAHFTQWSKQAIKIGLCDVPPLGHEASMLSLFNTSAMATLFTDILGQYNRLYSKKVYTHHYTKIDNFDLDLFEDCKETLQMNIENYSKLKQAKDIHKARFSVI